MTGDSTAKKLSDMEMMMDVYRQVAEPGKPHGVLAGMIGVWKVKGICWMEAGKPPVEHEGVSEQRMVLDGRFLRQEFTGEMMGRPFSGIGFTGYDNHREQYVSTWMDTMGTAIYYFVGTGSPDGKTITQTCDYDDPVQGPVTWRSVTGIIDADTFRFEMYTTARGGTEQKMAEMTYSRVK